MKRIRLITCVCVLLCTPGIALAEVDCKDPAAAKAAIGTLEADIETLTRNRKAHEKKLEDEIEAATEEQARAKQWDKRKKMEFIASHLSDKQFIELEGQKLPMLQQFMLALQDTAAHMDKGDDVNACLSAANAKTIMENMGKLNDQQYALMLKRAQGKQ